MTVLSLSLKPISLKAISLETFRISILKASQVYILYYARQGASLDSIPTGGFYRYWIGVSTVSHTRKINILQKIYNIKPICGQIQDMPTLLLAAFNKGTVHECRVDTSSFCDFQRRQAIMIIGRSGGDLQCQAIVQVFVNIRAVQYKHTGSDRDTSLCNLQFSDQFCPSCL